MVLLDRLPPIPSPDLAGMNWETLVFGAVALFSACYYVIKRQGSLFSAS